MSTPVRAARKTQLPYGYIISVPDELPAERELRHKKVAERRQRPIVIVHRGAAAFAPENTIEAYAAAMDYGADGCEIDLRRTIDGVLVLFHDDGLERMTDALGRLNQHTYYDLQQFTFRSIYKANPQARIPTFAALLELARQRSMLLHLDVKEPGLEADIARLLDAADAWDHVVAVNESNASELLKNPKLHLLGYKAVGLQEGRVDMDPVKVKEALAKPGNMIMVDDPRVAARELKRKSSRLLLPKNLRAALPSDLVSLFDPAKTFSPAAFLQALTNRVNARSYIEVEKLLTADFPERLELNGNTAFHRRRTARILERAWAAQQIGRRGINSRRAITLLEQQVVNRSFHREWAYFGLDGVMAARALGALRSTQSVPVLTQTFFTVDPELKRLMKAPTDYPFAWSDFSVKAEIVSALGEIRSDKSKKFLLDYLAMEPKTANQFAPPLFEEATRAVMHHDLSAEELRTLLQSKNPAVRGTAILFCVDNPTRQRAGALKSISPWALELPRRPSN